MSSIFTKIIRGEIPAHKLAEDERFLAFLDVNPVQTGHALVIPKQEIDYLFSLPDDLLGELFVFAKPVARAIESVVPCKRMGVTVVGLEVPHAHVHLIPINSIIDMDFSKKKDISNDQLADLSARIREAL